MMQDRGPAAEVARLLPSALAADAPRRYERIGDLILLKMEKVPVGSRRQIAAVFGQVLRARAVAVDHGVRGAWRLPEIEILWGDDTETIHVEDGVRFKLDIARVMFSSGNLSERMRMGRIVSPGETVVDLFAGIGQFTLAMAVHSRPARVIACEVNPEAFSYLEENIRLNRAWSVEPRLGDCRQTAPEGIADRIVMGYLHAQSFLDVAMRAAKDECALHYHENVPVEDSERASRHVVEAAAESGFLANVLAVHRIKSYAPRIRHLVVDARLTR